VVLLMPRFLLKVLFSGAAGLLLFPFSAFAANPTGSLAHTALPDSIINGGIAVAAKPALQMQPELLSSLPLPGNSLAALDAQLADAQNQLANAGRQLGQGQSDLRQLSDTMRLAMRDAGPDAGGLHPFVRVASRYMGTPYVWGGESKYGFDCSGFIIRVMQDLGYKTLPHSAAEQFNYGMPIAKANLKPGDLVFFANTYKPGISHVGIFIGRHRFIHAASTTKGTITSDIRDPFYVAHYAGARRLAPVK
jgi:cell wall-associated NlpC family hydrolase